MLQPISITCSLLASGPVSGTRNIDFTANIQSQLLSLQVPDSVWCTDPHCSDNGHCQDRDKLVPSVTNMTVETMPNDNLVHYIHEIVHIIIRNVLQLFGGEVTLNVTFALKISRPVKDEMMIK